MLIYFLSLVRLMLGRCGSSSGVPKAKNFQRTHMFLHIFERDVEPIWEAFRRSSSSILEAFLNHLRSSWGAFDVRDEKEWRSADSTGARRRTHLDRDPLVITRVLKGGPVIALVSMGSPPPPVVVPVSTVPHPPRRARLDVRGAIPRRRTRLDSRGRAHLEGNPPVRHRTLLKGRVQPPLSSQGRG